MKYLKYFLFFILGVIVLFVGLCFIGPKNLDTSQSIKISAPAPIIFNLVNSLKKAELWNDFTMNDSTLVTTYNDVASGIGAESSWTSEMSGAGKQKVISSRPNEFVSTELTFDGFNGVNIADFNISEEGNDTNVSWSFDGAALPFHWRGLALLTGMKKSMKKSYQAGLQNIKDLAEARAKGEYGRFSIKEEVLGEKNYVINRKEVPISGIQQFYATNLGVLFSKVQQAGVEMDGMPCGLFFNLRNANGIADMAAAIPVATPISVDGAASFNVPSQRAITMDYYGDYSGTTTGHSAIDEYMKDRGYLFNPPVIEEYVTDPSTEQDPNKWLTKITYYFSDGQ